MLTNSRDIKRRLEAERWVLVRVKGSHHQFRKAGNALRITLPHPKKDLQIGLVKSIYEIAGWAKD
jgi:predicted RNA binding protein YcfA (HicA-like mRNA interferase family)